MTHIFLAGATGAIGRPSCRLPVEAGYHVTGATRVPEKAKALRNLGVTPVVVDVFDAAVLRRLPLERGSFRIIDRSPSGLLD
jgi:uncharacterized protein YbjT (DUF2867 family)